MKLAGHVASTGTGDVHTGLSWNNQRERNHLEDLRVDGWTILKWICKWWDGEAWTGSGQGQVAGACECGHDLRFP